MTEMIIEFINCDLSTLKRGFYKIMMRELEKVPTAELKQIGSPSIDLDPTPQSTTSSTVNTPRVSLGNTPIGNHEVQNFSSVSNVANDNGKSTLPNGGDSDRKKTSDRRYSICKTLLNTRRVKKYLTKIQLILSTIGFLTQCYLIFRKVLIIFDKFLVKTKSSFTKMLDKVYGETENNPQKRGLLKIYESVTGIIEKKDGTSTTFPAREKHNLDSILYENDIEGIVKWRKHVHDYLTNKITKWKSQVAVCRICESKIKPNMLGEHSDDCLKRAQLRGELNKLRIEIMKIIEKAYEKKTSLDVQTVIKRKTIKRMATQMLNAEKLSTSPPQTSSDDLVKVSKFKTQPGGFLENDQTNPTDEDHAKAAKKSIFGQLASKKEAKPEESTDKVDDDDDDDPIAKAVKEFNQKKQKGLLSKMTDQKDDEDDDPIARAREKWNQRNNHPFAKQAPPEEKIKEPIDDDPIAKAREQFVKKKNNMLFNMAKQEIQEKESLCTSDTFGSKTGNVFGNFGKEEKAEEKDEKTPASGTTVKRVFGRLPTVNETLASYEDKIDEQPSKSADKSLPKKTFLEYAHDDTDEDPIKEVKEKFQKSQGSGKWNMNKSDNLNATSPALEKKESTNNDEDINIKAMEKITPDKHFLAPPEQKDPSRIESFEKISISIPKTKNSSPPSAKDSNEGILLIPDDTEITNLSNIQFGARKPFLKSHALQNEPPKDDDFDPIADAVEKFNQRKYGIPPKREEPKPSEPEESRDKQQADEDDDPIARAVEMFNKKKNNSFAKEPKEDVENQTTKGFKKPTLQKDTGNLKDLVGKKRDLLKGFIKDEKTPSDSTPIFVTKEESPSTGKGVSPTKVESGSSTPSINVLPASEDGKTPTEVSAQRTGQKKKPTLIRSQTVKYDINQEEGAKAKKEGSPGAQPRQLLRSKLLGDTSTVELKKTKEEERSMALKVQALDVMVRYGDKKYDDNPALQIRSNLIIFAY